MTASFPTSAWDGTSKSRPSPSGIQRAADGEDYRRLVAEIQAVQTLLDGIGLSTAGAFATSDPNKGLELYTNTLVLTKGGTAGAATFPNVWDGLSDSRTTDAHMRAPDYYDWLKVKEEINNIEKRVQPLGIPATGVLPTSKPATGGYLWANSLVVTASDSAGSHSNTLWDGSSPSRSNVDVRRAPDWQDYDEARRKLYSAQVVWILATFGALGALPTSEPAAVGAWWTSTNIVTVSNGP